jgi:O-antigen/teichoic acid export membrane protein
VSAVADVIHRRKGLATDSASIVVTYFVTAATGVLFWIAAARLIPAQDLGVQTALISLIMTIGTVTAYGVGSAFKAMLSVPACPRGKRILDGLVTTIVLSLVFGILGGLIAEHAVGGGAVTAVVVPVGSIIVALFVLKDSALIGLHAAQWLPVLNLVAVVLKVALVCLLAAMVGLAAVWATMIPAAVAALFAFVILTPRLVKKHRILTDDQPAADARLTRGAMAAFAFRDGVASSTSFGLILVLPFMTTWLAGPVPGATVAIALAVTQALDFVPDGMGAALTAHMARDPATITGKIRHVLLTSQCTVILGALALAAGSPLVGRLFGGHYSGAEFRTCLIVFAVGSVLRVPYSIWMSVLRASLDTSTILRLNAVAFAISLPVIVSLTIVGGSVGAATGLAVGSLILGGIGAWDLSRRFLRAGTPTLR